MVLLATLVLGVGACGSRSALEAPEEVEPDAFVPVLDAGIDAGPDAGDATALARVRITVTVGDDSLGDTDALRTDVSEDFVFVRLRDGGFVEVELNEGTTWRAHTTHDRTFELPSLATWDDVSSVGIRHVAAGNDWNADNWTMAEVVIASLSERGGATERYREAGAPVWQFRKNDNQVWEHAF